MASPPSFQPHSCCPRGLPAPSQLHSALHFPELGPGTSTAWSPPPFGSKTSQIPQTKGTKLDSAPHKPALPAGPHSQQRPLVIHTKIQSWAWLYPASALPSFLPSRYPFCLPPTLLPITTIHPAFHTSAISSACPQSYVATHQFFPQALFLFASGPLYKPIPCV